MAIDISKYDYIVYVDASGNDGVKYEDGSSLVYAVACFAVKIEHIAHNIEVLNKIKKLIGAKIEDEIKYPTIRKHFRSRELHTLIGTLTGTLFTSIIDKKEYCKNDNDYKGQMETKFFSAFCHTFPLDIMSKQMFLNEAVLIVIDSMKKKEMEVISLIRNTCEIDPKIKTYDMIYRDSKDRDFLLLQTADFLAGIMRDFIEGCITKRNGNSIPCEANLCNSNRILCRGKSGKLFPENYYRFNMIRHLLGKSNGNMLFAGITTFPSHIFRRYSFIDCPIIKNGIHKKKKR